MVATTMNRPKKPLYKNLNKLRRVKKQQRKKNHPLKKGAIQDAEIMPRGVLKKRMTSERANITLSGKKKRKIMRQLRRNESLKSQMEVTTSSKSKSSIKKTQRTKEDADVEMIET
uniref:Uncharacterized protein n=1 Tax=Ciona savignyi TaxID=51511 RepID=H2YSN3_CIOSA